MTTVRVDCAETGASKEVSITTSDVLVYLKEKDYIRGLAIVEGGQRAVLVYWGPMEEAWQPTGAVRGESRDLQLEQVNRGYELVPDWLITDTPELPTAKTIFQDMIDGDCMTSCGCVVEPDGYCDHRLSASATYYCRL